MKTPSPSFGGTKLSWRSKLSWLKIKRRLFPRGLVFTREGKVYVGVTLGVGFAAVNTGNNLLFLVLGLMLGLIVVSGILSEITLRNIAVSRKVPHRVEAGIPFPVELVLKNRKKWAASFGVELRDEINGKPFRRRCFFLRVGAKEERSVAYRCVLENRGRTSFDGTCVSTKFPFGLFEKRRFMGIENSVIVLPARLNYRFHLPLSAVGNGISHAVVGGIGQEFRELREMVHGDDPRKIHWKATARFGRPLVRETEAEAANFVELVLDPSPRTDNNDTTLAQVEKNISAAGTIVQDLINRGHRVRLVTTPNRTFEARDAIGSIPLLEHLALIDPHEAARSPAPTGKSRFAVLIGPRAQSGGANFRIKVPTASAVETGITR